MPPLKTHFLSQSVQKLLKKGFKGKMNHSIRAQLNITSIKLYWAVTIVAVETSFNESPLTVLGQFACCIRRMEPQSLEHSSDLP